MRHNYAENLEISFSCYTGLGCNYDDDLSTTSLSSAPVPINITLSPVSCSIFSINFLASAGNFEYSLTPAQAGKMTSSLVRANCVALFNCMDLMARFISNGAALLCLPVTLPYSIHPRFLASASSISFFRGPCPTLVTYDLKTSRTSSTLFGPTPTSEQIAEDVISFEVTNGYSP